MVGSQRPDHNLSTCPCCQPASATLSFAIPLSAFVEQWRSEVVGSTSTLSSAMAAAALDETGDTVARQMATDPDYSGGPQPPHPAEKAKLPASSCSPPPPAKRVHASPVPEGRRCIVHRAHQRAVQCSTRRVQTLPRPGAGEQSGGPRSGRPHHSHHTSLGRPA